MSEILERFRPLFYPRSIAVIGASLNPVKWGFEILHHLLLGGPDCKVYPVNPREKIILGLNCYPSIKQVPGEVDLAVITVPPEIATGVVKECAEKRVKAVVVVTAGYSEVGEREKKLEEELVGLAEQGKFLMIGPNCQGIMCTDSRIFAQIMGVFPLEGPLSIISQSGNIGGTLCRYCEHYNVGFSKFVSSGNEATTSSEDIIEYYGEDPETRVILAYIEGVDQGRKFFTIAKRVTRKKPIIMLKGGGTPVGARAVSSHTAALAGSNTVFDSACRQAGIIRVEALQDMLDLAIAFSTQPLPRGGRVGIVTMGGGLGVIAADACSRSGLEVIKLPEKTLEEMDKILPSRWSHNNPVDLAGAEGGRLMTRCIEALIRCPEIDGLIEIGIGFDVQSVKEIKSSPFFPISSESELATLTESFKQRNRRFAENLMRLIDESGKPLLSASDAVATPDGEESEAIKALRKRGIMVYPTPERATKALGALARYSKYLKETAKETL